MPRKKLSDYLPKPDPEPDNSQIENSGEDTSGGKSPFMPSLFEQLDTGTAIEASPVAAESKEEIIDLNPEDIEILVELPFDAAAQMTKWPGWSLATKETKSLAKLWIRPFRRWLKDVDNLDVYLAALTTVTIFGEKFIGYKIEQQARTKSSIANHRAGDAGLREDELSQELHQ